VRQKKRERIRPLVERQNFIHCGILNLLGAVECIAIEEIIAPPRVKADHDTPICRFAGSRFTA
jgi:hypothetical protein